MVSLQVAIVAMSLSGVGQTVLLDFYADWCGPCREMNPTVQALAAAGYPVRRVNISQNRVLADKYKVKSIPCFVMIVDGREVDRAVGKQPMGRLERMCKAGVQAGISSQPPPLLALNSAPSAQPIPPFASLPAAAPSPESLTDPWREPVVVRPVSTLTKSAAGISDAAMLAASVRIRVEDPDGRSCGSGTIIDSRGDEALVLTCGHIFRDSHGQGPITVDLFAGSGEPQTVAGRLVSFDLTRDVGLVAIRTPGPVGMARLAPPDYRIKPGQPVASVGCNDGDRPTVRHSQVNSLDKFQGPPNIQVAGQPVEGRSGGGLFSSEGYVIGICNAADPSDKEGLFAAPGSVYAELDRDRLAFVYNSPCDNPAGTLPAVSPVSPMMPSATGQPDLASAKIPPSPEGPPASMVVPASATEPIAPLPLHEQAALEEIRGRVKDGAEVLVVIRPRGNPEAKSEVLMLDHVSSEFVRQLSANGRRQDQPYTTSLALPKSGKTLPGPHKVLLEWSAPAGVHVAEKGNRGD